MDRTGACLLLCFFPASCAGPPPTAATPSSDASPSSTTPSDAGASTGGDAGGAPARPDGPRAFRLPIRPGDAANTSFGINPFGIHIAEHGSDGHPGFDFEYIPGASALAAADGTVDKVLTDVHDPTTSTVQLSHTIQGKPFRTVYTNLKTVDLAIAPGAPVTAGQVVGVPGTVTRFQGGRNVVYAMTHFQVDDFSRREGLTNVSAISPEGAFTDAENAVLLTLWARASYEQEPCEPFLTNPRGTTVNPTLTRTWVGATGASPARLEVSCASDGKGTTRSYRFLDQAGRELEAGRATVEVQPGGLTFADFSPASGPARKALIAITDARMVMAIAAPGAGRPGTLDGASTFTTSYP